MPLLEVKDLRKSYGELEVVRDVNLSLVVGVAPAEPAFHVLVLLSYAAVAFYVALVLTRRRLLS